MHTLKLMTQAQKGAKKLSAHGLKDKALKLLEIIKKILCNIHPTMSF